MPLDAVRFRFSSDGLPGVPLQVDDLRLEETIDRPYELKLRLLTSVPDVDASLLLGRNAELTLERLPVTRRVLGVVRAVREGGQSAGGLTIIDVEVVPALWMASLRRNTRMFQGQNALEIVRAVLGEALGPYGRAVEVGSVETPPTREYCLQYQETDLAFVHRLLQEEGIHYFFDHDGATETVVLSDVNSDAEPVATAPTPGRLPYEGSVLTVRDVEPIHRFERNHRSTTTAVTIRDWDWTEGRQPIHVEAPGDDELGRVRESYEHGEGRSLTIGSYDQGVRRYQANDADRQAPARQQALRAPGLAARGIGRALGLAPGRRFALVGHPTVGFDEDYFVTRTVLRSVEAEELTAAGGTEPFHVEFECIPFSVRHRPRRVSKKPRIPSMQTAIVTGPPGEEIHTDEWGRVTVQFPWDRENPRDDTASTWIRVSQAQAGVGWGSLWIPRVGMEVIVQFVDGDPDRPVVTGTLYGGANPPPYDLPAEKAKSTIKSNSYPGGGGYNEIRFDDSAGAEEIFVHAQYDYNRVTGHNETHRVGVDQSITVGQNQTIDVGVNQDVTIGVDQTLSVGANQTIDVGGNRVDHVGGTSNLTIDGHFTETLNAGHTLTVNAGRTSTVNAFETTTVNGPLGLTVNGPVTETFSATHTRTVGGASTDTIGGDTTSTHAGTYTQSVGGTYTLNVGQATTVNSLGAYAINCPVSVTITTPSHDVITGKAFQTDGWSGNLIGMSVTATGVALSAAGVVAGAHALKGEFNGVLATSALVDLGHVALKSESYGVKSSSGGPTINLLAISLQVTSIFICC